MLLQNIHNLWTIKICLTKYTQSLSYKIYLTKYTQSLSYKIYLTKYAQSLDYKDMPYKLRHSRQVHFLKMRMSTPGSTLSHYNVESLIYLLVGILLFCFM